VQEALALFDGITLALVGIGAPVPTPLNDRVLSMRLDQVRRVKRVVGIAGGRRKFDAIRGALRGNWINVLVTDRFMAERLVKEAEA
jgi:DNA-binding transcriptional regulator LsrR (DeoR family)